MQCWQSFANSQATLNLITKTELHVVAHSAFMNDHCTTMHSAHYDACFLIFFAEPTPAREHSRAPSGQLLNDSTMVKLVCKGRPCTRIFRSSELPTPKCRHYGQATGSCPCTALHPIVIMYPCTHAHCLHICIIATCSWYTHVHS